MKQICDHVAKIYVINTVQFKVVSQSVKSTDAKTMYTLDCTRCWLK